MFQRRRLQAAWPVSTATQKATGLASRRMTCRNSILAEVLVLAAPIYYFTLCAQIQAPIQRMYCVNAPAKVKKMALLMSSYSPGVYDGAMAEFRDICNYWKVENMGAVTAKIDEQKTEETKQKVVALVSKL